MEKKTFNQAYLPSPVLNHRTNISSENMGWCSGVTNSGVPFEMEDWYDNNNYVVSIIMPQLDAKVQELAIRYFAGLSEEEKTRWNVVGFPRDLVIRNMGVLDSEFDDGEIITDSFLTSSYIEFLIGIGLIEFVNEGQRNGVVTRIKDYENNDLVRIMMVLRVGEEVLGKHSCMLIEFPGNEKIRNRERFKVVK